MAVDVIAEVVIQRPRDQVATYAMDPQYEPEWISGIRESRMLTDPPLGEGTRVHRVARFLGRRIEYILEVSEYDPEHRLAMRSVKSPFPMRVTYEFEEVGSGTRARIHVQGGPDGLLGLVGPLLAMGVRRNISRDLKNLKSLLEADGQKA